MFGTGIAVVAPAGGHVPFGQYTPPAFGLMLVMAPAGKLLGFGAAIEVTWLEPIGAPTVGAPTTVDPPITMGVPTGTGLAGDHAAAGTEPKFEDTPMPDTGAGWP
jgi:hypothetical protein